MTASRRDPSVPEAPSTRASYATQAPVEITGGALDGRVQAGLALALVAVVVLVPLYMWRRPPAPRVDLALALAAPRESSATDSAPAGAQRAPLAVALEAESCRGRQGRRVAGRRCESLAALAPTLSAAAERAEACRALVESRGAAASLSVRVDFATRALEVRPVNDGATGSVAACARAVEQAASREGWADVPHSMVQYRLTARIMRASPEGEADTRPAPRSPSRGGR